VHLEEKMIFDTVGQNRREVIVLETGTGEQRWLLRRMTGTPTCSNRHGTVQIAHDSPRFQPLTT
jgi:hypothetical protein